ncbi:MAG: glycosyltransferase [Bacillota bacterium]
MYTLSPRESGSKDLLPLVSIIIPVYNKVEYTRQCVESLCRTLNLSGGKIEIIIVDDNSTDGTKAYLKTLPGCFRVVTNSKNVGCGKAMNRGASIARGQYFVFLNNDTVALPGWLDELMKVIKTEKNVGLVGSKLLFPDGTIQHAGVIITNSLEVFHIYYRKPGDSPEVDEFSDYQAVTGACILIKKDLFLEVGCYDDDYANSHLDIDLCLKVKQKGYRIVYCPRAVLYHYESVSDGRKKHDNKDERIFINKWRNNFLSYNKRRKPQLVSIVIPCYNKLKYTRLCLENIFIYTSHPFEVILVDNCSSDGTGEYLEQLKRKHKNVIIIKNSHNHGWGAACNQGINAASGDYVLFMHSDVAVTEGWLCRMLWAGNSCNNIGIIGPRSNSASGAQLVRDARYRNELEMHQLAWEIAVKSSAKGIYTDRVHGCCMLVKKELIRVLRGFNTGSEHFREDFEFCRRAKRSGYKIGVCSNVFVHHFGGTKAIKPDVFS